MDSEGDDQKKCMAAIKSQMTFVEKTYVQTSQKKGFLATMSRYFLQE